jgi:hypothetical protein
MLKPSIIACTSDTIPPSSASSRPRSTYPSEVVALGIIASERPTIHMVSHELLLPGIGQGVIVSLPLIFESLARCITAAAASSTCARGILCDCNFSNAAPERMRVPMNLHSASALAYIYLDAAESSDSDLLPRRDDIHSRFLLW